MVRTGGGDPAEGTHGSQEAKATPQGTTSQQLTPCSLWGMALDSLELRAQPHMGREPEPQNHTERDPGRHSCHFDSTHERETEDALDSVHWTQASVLQGPFSPPGLPDPSLLLTFATRSFPVPALPHKWKARLEVPTLTKRFFLDLTHSALGSCETTALGWHHPTQGTQLRGPSGWLRPTAGGRAPRRNRRGRAGDVGG